MISDNLHGKRVDDITVRAVYDPKTNLFTFEDGSYARMITKLENCEPHLSSTLSTISVRPYKVWVKK